MLVSLTVGKVDAGVAVLLTEDKRLIEFPSILLPPSITSGSIVDITVSRNPDLETSNEQSFLKLQDSILHTYGLQAPSPPTLRLRNATQTSIVLEWDPLELATASRRSLSLYRNGAKAGLIPRQGRDGDEVLATKISGLAVDTEYTFHLVLRTSAGTFQSPKLVVRTHKMTDLTGITVSPGPLPQQLRESLNGAIERIGAKVVEGVRIETTHFVCTEGRGRDWERAVEMNIPVVRPEWVEGCEREGRIVGVRGYYLGADPRQRQVGPSVLAQQQSSSQQQKTTAPDVSQQQDGPADDTQAEQGGGNLSTLGQGQAGQSETSLPQTPVTPFPPVAPNAIASGTAASSTQDLPHHGGPPQDDADEGDIGSSRHGDLPASPLPPQPPAKDTPPPPTITTTAASPPLKPSDRPASSDAGDVAKGEEADGDREGSESPSKDDFSEVQL